VRWMWTIVFHTVGDLSPVRFQISVWVPKLISTGFIENREIGKTGPNLNFKIWRFFF
jgi:hypothetical protein